MNFHHEALVIDGHIDAALIPGQLVQVASAKDLERAVRFTSSIIFPEPLPP